MASRIKGITVEIGGDTTGLEKALKSVNSTIRNTQSQLKDVTKLLKLDPKNTELLSQKQRLLKDAISATKDKLEALKEAQKQAKEQLENGTLGQDKYDALQREIIETEEELRRLQKEAETTTSVLTKIDTAGKKMQEVGDNIAGAGKKMLPVTAAITGIGTAAVKTASDFDASMSNVSAISGAVGEDLNALRDKAREMGAKTKFSASEAADAMGYMAMAGWKTEDMLSGIEGVMNLAAASGEDLATTSDIVTDALTAFGLSAKDSGHFADILAAASSNANTNVSMMGQTFKYTAPIAGALGFSAEDTAEAIGLMANAGIKSTQAGTSLRTIMNSLTGPIDLVGENLGEVTIQTTNADGSMRDLSDILADCRSAFSLLSESEQANTAEALVGKNAMSGFLALMNGKFKQLIDIYNSHTPLALGYKVKYTDEWCDTTVSAAAIQAGMVDLIGTECGCERHIAIFRKLGIWIEDGTITPKPGYIIVYNWNTRTQPNDGFADHIGVVDCVKNGVITCIEGNKGEAVGYRSIPVGWGYIRGYAAPKYDKEEETAQAEARQVKGSRMALRQPGKEKEQRHQLSGQNGTGRRTS